MAAYLFPYENGYVAVTEADGSFEIANLPAGEELEFQVWHEIGAGRGSGLPFSGSTAAGTINLKLDENEDRKLDAVVPAASFKW